MIMQSNANDQRAKESSYELVSKLSRCAIMFVPTISNHGMDPGHPFARESEHNVAVLEFGCHCNHKRFHIQRSVIRGFGGAGWSRAREMTRSERREKCKVASRDFLGRLPHTWAAVGSFVQAPPETKTGGSALLTALWQNSKIIEFRKTPRS